MSLGYLQLPVLDSNVPDTDADDADADADYIRNVLDDPGYN